MNEAKYQLPNAADLVNYTNAHINMRMNNSRNADLFEITKARGLVKCNFKTQQEARNQHN